MIGKVSVSRGRRCEPLVRYLYGPGRANEHTDPHIVAAWRPDHQVLEPVLHPDGKRDFRRLTGMLRAPHEVLERPYERPVWHCSVRAAPGDRMLSDDEWAGIARDIMDRTGLHRTGEDDRAVRWIAVRHAPDHIHLVALLARQDGTKPVLRGDWYQVGAACRAAEDRFGLTVTAPRDRTAARRPSRAETEKTARQGRRMPARITLQQLAAQAAAAAASEAQYFAWLENAGVLVRRRHSTRDPGQVTGYAVSLPGDTGQDGQQVWYGGGRLAADLTLPRLRARWPADRPGTGPRGGPLTPDERTAIWEHAARTAAAAAGAIRADPGSAADIAWAAAGFLHGAAAATGSPYLRQAARAYDRAARPRYARIPAPAPAGTALRAAARALFAVAATAGDKGTRDAMKTMALVIEIVALIEVIAASRQAARLAAQAAAAREAARFATAARAPGHAPYQPGRARQAVLDFPQGPVTSGQGPRRDTAPARRPRPGPRQPGRGR